MKRKNWYAFVIWILLMEIVGGCAWLIMRSGIELYQANADKPLFAAPAIVYYIVWAVLYALMGISIARIRLIPDNPAGQRGSNHFVMQLIMNFFWGQIFFNSQCFGFAFACLLVLLVFLVLMILDFYKADPLSAWLQIPYLLWVIYSGVLNCCVWILNR